MRRAAEVPIDYELSITSHLPKRDAIMKSKNNKRKLASELSTFTLGDMTTIESRDDSAFDHNDLVCHRGCQMWEGRHTRTE